MVAVIALVVLVQACAIVLSFTVPKDRRVVRWFYVPSLLIAWGSYLAYETFYIPRHCSGDCSIRVDLLIIYPYLALVTVGAITYFARQNR